MNKRQLVLEDGTVLIGEGFGSMREVSGEIIFNTSMTGYQEIMTDPAYYKKLLFFTYPLIGNCGIHLDDFEGIHPFLSGLIIKELSKYPSRSIEGETLENYLIEQDIPGIAEIDTRKLMRHIQKHGTMKGKIASLNKNPSEIVKKLKKTTPLKSGIIKVATEKPYIIPGHGKRIVVVDLGMKHSILRSLTKRNYHVTVVPYNYSANQILRLKPEAMIITSGPGDPRELKKTIQMIKDIIGKIPLLAIGLGMQVFALALGAEVEKMFICHSGPYAVKDLLNNYTFMTTQNHHYDVLEDSLRNTPLQITHVNLQDWSIEGLKHKQAQAFSVQFYPESTPGPRDSLNIFTEFLNSIKQGVEIRG